MKKNTESVIDVIRVTGIPLGISYVAQVLDIHWTTTYRLIIESILEDLSKDPTVFQRCRIIPVKTTRQWFFKYNDSYRKGNRT